MIPQSIVTTIDTILRSHGFNAMKATWNRKAESFVDVVSLQMDNNSSEFAVNVGVLYPHAFTECFGKKPPAVADDIHCTARWRLREGEPAVEWWKIDDAHAPMVVARALEKKSVPMMDGLHSLGALERFLAEMQVTRGRSLPEEAYRAIVLADLGRMQEARPVLAALSSKTSGPWRVRIAEVEARLEARTI
jgi:hypothetical protein